MPKKHGNGLLFEMLRSFVALVETLNLTKAAEITASTRQTVRRHVEFLEDARGVRFFELVERRYQLTQDGRVCFKAAKELLERGNKWLTGEMTEIDGLSAINHEDGAGQVYKAEQQDMRKLWQSGTARLQFGFSCWAKAKTHIDNQEMDPIRPYLVIYRLYKGSWQCVEIGEESLFAQWLGRDWAKSNVGHDVGSSPVNSAFAEIVFSEYEEAHYRGCIRYDHIFRIGKKEGERALRPLKFQRLLLGGTFPDGSSAVLVLAEKVTSLDLGI